MAGERLGSVDRAWLRLDRPDNPMRITGVLTFDAPLDLARLRRTLEERLLTLPRFRQRVEGSRWVDVERFDVADHVEHVVLPPGADRALLSRRIGALVSTRLDPARPLWRLTALENPDGRTVLVARVHHCVGDGFALMAVLLGITDASPEGGDAPREVDRPPSGGGWRRRLSSASLGASALDLLRLLAAPRQPETRLRGPLGLRKRVAWSPPVPLSEVKATARALGGTVNDVLMAAVAGALRRYLLAHGERPPALRCTVPVSLRAVSEMRALGNRFGLVFVDLPLDLATPRARYAALKRRMDRLKRRPEALLLWQLMRLTGAGPRWLEALAAAVLGAKASMVVTNVPGPREPRYLAGQRIQTIMFWVPQAGRIGVGVSVFSYAGEVRLGLSVDERLVRDPERVLQAFGDELEALAGLGGEVIGRAGADPSAPSPPAR